jgi:hypothetical protein
MIALANRSTVMTDTEVSKIADAVSVQVHTHFRPLWGIDADIVFVGSEEKAPAHAWLVAVLDNSDQANALGYHDVTRAGMPLGKAFAKTTLADGGIPSVAISHEILEMLGDPEINLSAMVGHRLYAYEVGDPCEADEYGYKIGDVVVSDFVTPAWFKPTTGTKGPYDYRGLIKKPLQLLKGGYLQYLDIGASGGWQQVTADRKPNARARAHHGSRRERRRVGHAEWQRSERH